MARCEGSTKAGERCKRSAREGERFCSTHAGSAAKATDETAGDTGQKERARRDTDTKDSYKSECVERDVFDAMFGLATAGVVIVVALVLRRFIRIF